MALGGKRPGAGGKKGSPNKATQAQREAIAASGLTPLEYLLGVMRDENAPVDRRDEMAKAAAPYVHARLSSVDMKAEVDTHDDWLTRYRQKQAAVADRRNS